MRNISFSFFFLLTALFRSVAGSNCEERSFTARSSDLGYVHIVQRIAILAPLSLFYVYVEISDGHTTRTKLYTSSGSPLILYSSLSISASEWQTLDVLARKIYVVPVYKDVDITPTVMITVCKYSTPISYFDDSMYGVDIHKVGIVSMYENQLIVMFRTFESGIFIFSMADQGDVFIAQIVQGKIFVIFDFGSLTRTTISGGAALNDGEWHEMRWIHQFDSVQLYVDGIVMNSTTPSGLYRKLDFDTQIYIGGKPSNDMNTDIEDTYHGCFARIMLNSVDLLANIPRQQRKDCQMPKPQLMSIMHGGHVTLPFSFLPFSIEFRILSEPSTVLLLIDGKNDSLLRISLDSNGSLVLTLFADISKIEQISQQEKVVSDGSWHALSLMIWGSTLHVDVDSYTVLRLENNAVRNIAKQLVYFRLAAIGCYRSATVFFKSSNIVGNVTFDACHFQERCLPNPCENGAVCEQISLNDFKCKCPISYYGKTCHATRRYRSCEDFFRKNPYIKSKNISIDLDGGNPLAPFMVLCEQNSNNQDDRTPVTTLFHQYQNKDIVLSGNYEPGSVKKSLNYGVDKYQLDRFIEGFENCEQYMRYECRGGAKLMSYGFEQRPSSWYSARNNLHGMQWANAPPYSRMCPCAANSSCIHNRMCNCDSGEDSIDEGYNPHMQLLPVMVLYLGGTTTTSSINVTIGAFTCTHRYVFDGITFLDRDARLTDSQSLVCSVMDLELQIRMSHSEMTIFAWESLNGKRWYQLYVADGHFVGQVVSGNKVFEIGSKIRVNDDKWHTVYWEVSVDGMMITVDNDSNVLDVHIALPKVYTWTLGSRPDRKLSGFAGQIRNMHLCGSEIILRALVRKQGQKGIELGEKGTCTKGDCLNNGQCIEFYDSHKCNCSNTPFVGHRCNQDVSLSVAKGSELSIPWQHPAHVSSCFRIAVQSFSSNYSLMRAKALFAECQFNLTINAKGRLELSVFDGFFFHHKAADIMHKFDGNELVDVKFCAKKTRFILKINDEDAIRITGNWSFFRQLNVWTFVDKNFTGCVARLQIGTGFPLKDPSSSRLSYKGDVRFGSCSNEHVLVDQELTRDQNTAYSGIQIYSAAKNRTSLLILMPLVGVVTGCAIFLFILTIICWIRNRPDGVYKINENALVYTSPNRSEEPLVASNFADKEYFC